MSKCRALIVDDEVLARQKISRFLSEHSQVFEVAEAASGIEALDQVHKFRPDILFLDIEMPGLNGIEVLQQIANKEFKIIFQTAFDDFAIQAFEHSACDYLLKPFTQERFDLALERALNAIDHEAKLQRLEAEALRKSQFLRKIVIKEGSRTRIFIDSEILCFLSQDHYTCVHTRESEGICDLSLSHLQERLDPAVFIRAHRKAIVNLSAIEAITKSGGMALHLTKGMSIPVSRRNQSQVSAAISKL